MTILQKTWSMPYNARAIPTLPDTRDTAASQSPEFLRTLKEGLVNATPPWTVVASSNGTVAGTSTGDNWNANTDVHRGGPLNGGTDTWPGSWIILKSPGLPSVYMLIDYTAASTYKCTVRWSESQPDISTLSAYRVPEATGPEINSVWEITEPSSGAYEYYVTMMTATDGSFVYIGTTTDISDDNVLMFHRLRDVSPLDPHPWVVWQKTIYLGRHQFVAPNAGINNDVFSLAPDGTQVEGSFAYPAVLHGTSRTEIASLAADDPQRNWRPFSWPIRVVTRTAGYEGFKGYLEDFWWAAAESPTNDNIRWMQPGFEGQNAVVGKRGCWWMPAPEPFRW